MGMLITLSAISQLIYSLSEFSHPVNIPAVSGYVALILLQLWLILTLSKCSSFSISNNIIFPEFL